MRISLSDIRIAAIESRGSLDPLNARNGPKFVREEPRAFLPLWALTKRED